ncbi:hypothetical protein TBLA_0A07560 [Henningerozyma blattae CBS 6284]|uniref:Peptidase M3A/M3B catalytic domain-containing protein n=1 Tax=Henningerozyma blattae (strain ATCC 34711 / CBS 6284 / DSM 70876 / NBRC 10599 / NRRL Y-10934 / UCD 77-7) TaxID=1071380 RepID=I2GWP4_HENB6|nr:hypothetical protein TBLA_0A07560 [Tetrapisispora blattae CBS 6284]CCH58546.1 hypothetical protein TBLA_0A07560 [Tetrapisispora blattae CBS 6284]
MWLANQTSVLFLRCYGLFAREFNYSIVFKNQFNLRSIQNLPLNFKSSYSSMSSSACVNLNAPQAAPTWNWTPSQLVKDAEDLIDQSNHFYDALTNLKSPDFNNFLVPYMNYENKVGSLINQLTFLQHVSSEKDIRDASFKATDLLQNFEIETSLRYGLFLQFDKIWNQIKDSKDKYEKDPKDLENYEFVRKVHRDFVRAGLNLDESKREKIKEIKKAIANNSLKFATNLGEQTEFVAFTKEELDGVSDSVMEQFEKFNDEKTGKEMYKVTFKYPDIFPVLKTARNPETRKKAFAGDQNKVSENTVLFTNTLKLRNQLADILGYSTYANYNLELKMAKAQDSVFKFLEDLIDRLKPLGSKEIEILKSIKEKEFKELNLPFDNHYYVWDHRYYDNKYLKDNYNVDLEKISEYYPLDSTIEGMLNIYETLLNLKFIEEKDDSKNKNVWHKEVKQLAVWKMDNPENPEFVGWIYFDLHPRDGKYGHAANFGISSSYIKPNNERSYPVTALVCNFSKVTADKPALLKHNEITTFFHELGHGIHDLVGKNNNSRFNGPGAVPWDFVEAPSQMLEFWTWNKNELLSLSKHYKTGEKIPTELLNSLVATKHVNGALFALRQLHFGLFDMKVHTSKDLENLDFLKLWNELREEVSLVENGDLFTKGYDSFGHIMSDSYSAGYYGYMWAEVFATDMYYTKFAANPLETKVGVEYRDWVLARGGLYEIEDNLIQFLGRKPSNEAFLKELGLN